MQEAKLVKGDTTPGLLLSQEHCKAQPEHWNDLQKQHSRLSLRPSARPDITA
jgi:hypothetical protein